MEEIEKLLSVLNPVTVISCIIIVAATIFFAIYIVVKKKKHRLNECRQWVEQMPTIVSTLGVLGTFFGITIGLYDFNTSDLDNSIPLLLSGLKTAFVTSLAGMVGALILTRIVNKCFDDVDSNDNKFRNDLVSSFGDVITTLSNTNEVLYRLATDLQQMKDDVEEIKGQCDEIKEQLDATHVKRLIGVVTTAAESISRIDDKISDVREKSLIISENVENYADELDEIRDILSNN